jgi:hypothetical protein
VADSFFEEAAEMLGIAEAEFVGDLADGYALYSPTVLNFTISFIARHLMERYKDTELLATNPRRHPPISNFGRKYRNLYKKRPPSVRYLCV